MEPAPRTAVYITRVQLALVALVVLAGLIAGIAMQLELWTPGGASTGDSYSRMLGLHGVLSIAFAAPALAGCFGYLAIAELVGARRVIAPAVAWLGLVLWVIGLVATVVALARHRPDGWSFYTPYSVDISSYSISLPAVGPLAFGLASLVYATHLGVMIIVTARSVAPARIVLAGMFVLALAAAGVWSLVDTLGGTVLARGAFTLPAARAFDATRFAALVLATIALARGITRGPHALLAVIAVGCAAVWAFTPLRMLGLAVIGVWIALAVLGGGWRPIVAIVTLGIAPAIAMHIVARTFTSDVPLHDTYFAVGVHHLVAMIIAFAALAALHEWSAPIVRRTAHPLFAWLGATTCSAGMLLHVYASLRLGARGMPRRYWDYDPDFTAGHQLAGASVVVILVGLGLLVVAWAVGRRSSRV